MTTEILPNPHAMKPGDETAAPKPARVCARPHLDPAILAELRDFRGALDINLNMFQLRYPTLRAWQDRLDAILIKLGSA
jgi:hypothetical protein